jgi:hypothetical protein
MTNVACTEVFGFADEIIVVRTKLRPGSKPLEIQRFANREECDDTNGDHPAIYR